MTLVARSALRNVTRELRERVAAPIDLQDDEAARLAVERERYARDPIVHLVATEAWETDKGLRRDGHVFVPHTITQEDTPLRPFAAQASVIRAVVDQEVLATTGRLVLRNVHVEKSRQMGFTWIFAWLWLWAITYHDVALGYLSMTSDEVDDGGRFSSVDSFFGKIRHLHASMPPRFRAPLRFVGGNDPSITNLGRTRAFIVGESANADPGRGGRYAGWLWDEAAYFPHSESAYKALSRAVPTGLVLNSTPRGEAGAYFRIRRDRPKGWIMERHHWTTHELYGAGQHIACDVAKPNRDQQNDPGPTSVAQALTENLKRQPTAEARKAAASCPVCLQTAEGVRWTADAPVPHRYPGKLTSPWYDDAVVGMTDEQVASELDIDYTASLTARVFPRFSEEQHVVDSIPYSPEIHEVTMSIDFGLDITAIGIYQETPRELRMIGELEATDADPDSVVRALRETLADLGVAAADLNHPLWLQNQTVIGDPAADDREVGTAKSLTQLYAQAGLIIQTPKRMSVARTIVGVTRLLNGKPRRFVIARDRCPKTITHFKLNRWPTDRFGVRKAGATAPLDDEHNHMLRGLAYYVARRWPAAEDDTADQVEAATRAAIERASSARESTASRGIRQGMKL